MIGALCFVGGVFAFSAFFLWRLYRLISADFVTLRDEPFPKHKPIAPCGTCGNPQPCWVSHSPRRGDVCDACHILNPNLNPANRSPLP